MPETAMDLQMIRPLADARETARITQLLDELGLTGPRAFNSLLVAAGSVFSLGFGGPPEIVAKVAQSVAHDLILMHQLAAGLRDTLAKAEAGDLAAELELADREARGEAMVNGTPPDLDPPPFVVPGNPKIAH